MNRPFRIPITILTIFIIVMLLIQLLPLYAAGACFSLYGLPELVSSVPPASAFSSSTPSMLEEDPETAPGEKIADALPVMEKSVSPKEFESISSAAVWCKWAALVNSGQLETDGHTFTLTGHLDFSDDSYTFVPVGTLEHPFSGTFDGNGYRLIGIDVAWGNEDSAAPFGYTSGASITALGVETSEKGLLSARYAAGLVGVDLGETTLSSCYFTGILSGETTGGLVAEARGRLRISNCYAIVSHLIQKGWNRAKACCGVLIGETTGAENNIRIETSYGLSPDRSVDTLFGEGDTQRALITDAVYLLDIDNPDLLTQINMGNLEGFDFHDVWKQPNDDALPLLQWQEPQPPVSLQYTYSYGTLSPVAVSNPDNTIHINTGQQAVFITAARQLEDTLLYSNLALSDNWDGYVLELSTEDIAQTATFIGINRGQASVAQLSFSRIDDNSIHGTVRGLDEGTYYTVSLRSVGGQRILSETFFYGGWKSETYQMSGIPEGTYQIDFKATGYHRVEKIGISIDSTKETVLDAEFFKSIETVEITGLEKERVDLYSHNRLAFVITPEDAGIGERETEVWLSGKIAQEQDYQLTWYGNDSFVFVPNVSGAFVIRISVHDRKGVKYTDTVTVNAYREIQNIILPHTVDITAIGGPVEITPRILPTDATDTQLDWTLVSGDANISLSLEGNVCRVSPKKAGVATIMAKSANGIERTVRIRVLDNIPPAFGEATFENITAVDRVMVSFHVEDDCEVAQVTAVSKSGEPVSVSRLASQKNGYAFEGALETEYTITATDSNGNSETMTAMTAELFQAGTGNAANYTNSGLAVSKSEDSISLWVSANESEGAKYHWQKRAVNGEWTSSFQDMSKLEDSGLAPNTWYEYRVEVLDNTGNAVTKTSAVRTNPTPIRANDIEIRAGDSYGAIYVGETFPVVAVISNQADVTGQSHAWQYDQDAMSPETPDGNIFVAKRAGIYPLEYRQTDTFGNTVNVVKMVEILSMDVPRLAPNRRFMQILWPMMASMVILALLAFWRDRREKAKLQ